MSIRWLLEVAEDAEDAEDAVDEEVKVNELVSPSQSPDILKTPRLDPVPCMSSGENQLISVWLPATCPWQNLFVPKPSKQQ